MHKIEIRPCKDDNKFLCQMIRATNLLGISELILATILVASLHENQFFSLNHIVS